MSRVQAGILERDVDRDELPRATHGGVRNLVRSCLRKDLRHRLHAIADATIELEEVVGGESSDPVASSSRSTSGPRSWTSASRELKR
ncbi:MAG TPA: hypothetical protein VMO47_02825 [Rhodothermales bacterium]|nr:hypothetical protein [Rhodothermales bacterium]